MSKIVMFCLLFVAFTAHAIDSDNDGFDDAVDAFPYDPCGATDTDNDGMPDELLACSSSAWNLADSFESGDFSAQSWVLGGAIPEIDGPAPPNYYPNGLYAAFLPKSASFMELAYIFNQAGRIAFDSKIYSGSNVWLEFYIDDVLQGDINGVQGWERKYYSVGAGPHTFKWVYKKSGSLSLPEHLAVAYLDYIVVAWSALVEDLDDDNDGFSDLQEINRFFTDSLVVTADGDGDGVPDSADFYPSDSARYLEDQLLLNGEYKGGTLQGADVFVEE